LYGGEMFGGDFSDASGREFGENDGRIHWAAQRVRFDGETLGETELQQCTNDQASVTGQVLKTIRRITKGISRTCDVCSRKIRSEVGAANNAKVHALAANGGDESEPDRKDRSAH